MNSRRPSLTGRALLLGTQVVAVATLTTMVGWPKYRPAPRPRVWFVNGPAVPAPGAVLQDARLLSAQDEAAARRQARLASADTSARAAAAAAASENTLLQSLQSASTSDDAQQLRALGALSNALVGRAITDTGQRVPYARLILRNTLTGQIEGRAVADQNGNFTFTDVLGAGYVIEMVGADGSVVATSGVVAINNGDLKQTTVRITGNSTMRAIFGNVLPTTPTAQDTLNPIVNTGSANVTLPAETSSPGR
ncbi:MAG TPA: carboxypeptidase-like regulatory domain-containing protein [Vicinamibacterales bacterium]|nr:carboxypeptidase-like regulatory domain-containing protein [Vicinamibacterales bacterium]